MLDDESVPLSPYRVIRDLLATVDEKNTIITHDAGSPRDQLSPFWRSTEPLSYIGWGKTTQLGYGLGLAMGAKIARPEKLCINVWGDAAIGMTGMDFETAVRERIPILSVLFNNFSMAIEIPVMPVSQEKYNSTDISGHYADFATALGGYGERVEQPSDIIPAIKPRHRANRGGQARAARVHHAAELHLLALLANRERARRHEDYESAAGGPQPPPPGVSMRTMSPGSASNVAFPASGSSSPSRSRALRPGSAG